MDRFWRGKCSTLRDFVSALELASGAGQLGAGAVL